MAIAVECRNCGKRYKVDDKFAGKRGKCKTCGGAIAVPAAPVPVRQEPDDPFAAMEELERTGKVSEDVPFAAALPLPAVATAPAAAPPRARGTVYNPQLAAAAKSTRYGAIAQESGPTSMFWQIVGPPGVNFWIFAGLVVLGVLSLVTLTTSQLMGLPLLVCGIAFVVIGGFWFRILGWQHGHKFPYTWIPGADFVFAIQNFGVMSRPIFCWLRGMVLVGVAMVVVVRAGVSTLNQVRSQAALHGGSRSVAQGTPTVDEAVSEADDEGDSDAPAKSTSKAPAPPKQPDVEVAAPAVIKPFPAPDPKLVEQLGEPTLYGSVPYMVTVPKNFNTAGSFAAPRFGSLYVTWQKEGTGRDNYRAPTMSYNVATRKDKSQRHPRVFTHFNARQEFSLDEIGEFYPFENARVEWGSIDGVEFARAVGRAGDAAHSIGYLTYVAFDGEYVIHLSAQNVSPGTPTFELLDAAIKSFKRHKE